MAFSWVGAAEGASKAATRQRDELETMLLREFQKRQAEQAMALQQQRLTQDATQFDASMGLQKQQLAALETERTEDRAYRGRQEARQATQDRGVENQRGTRRMIGDFLVQRGGKPIGPGERQTLAGMAVQEDVDLPEAVTRDPNADLAEYEAKRKIDARYRPPDQPSGSDFVMLMSPQGQVQMVPKGQQANQALASGWKLYEQPKTRGPIGQERSALAFYNRAKQAMDTVDTLETQIAGQGTAGQLQGQYAPNLLQTQPQQQYRQAQRAFTEARLRKESGAAIPEGEYANDARTYFAQPGDTPDLIAQKRQARQAVLDGIGFAAGPAYEEFYGEPFQKNAAAVNPNPQPRTNVGAPVLDPQNPNVTGGRRGRYNPQTRRIEY